MEKYIISHIGGGHTQKGGRLCRLASDKASERRSEA